MCGSASPPTPSLGPHFCLFEGQLLRAGTVRSKGRDLGLSESLGSYSSRPWASTSLTTLLGEDMAVLGCHAILTEEQRGCGSLPSPRFIFQKLPVISHQRKQPQRKSASLQR